MVFRVDNRDFAPGNKVRMGSGETGKIVSADERNGIKGYRVEITDGPRKGSVVGANPGGMVKLGRRSAQSRVAVTLGDRRYMCRVAETVHQHKQGLQGVPDLDPDEGMLFLFNPPRAATFHMGTVPYPIDIVFVEGGRVAKVVHGAQPGSAERWSHPRCEAVLELAAGQARKVGALMKMAAVPGGRYPAPALDGAPGKHYEISFPNELEEPSKMPQDRYKDRGTPDEADPNADQMSADEYKQSYGYDALEQDGPPLRSSAQRISDKADYIVGLIEAMARQERPLDWHRDALNPMLAYAVVSPSVISEWLSSFDLSGSEATDVLATATSRQGLQVLGDGLVLAGIANTAHIAQNETNEDMLVLWTEQKDLQNV